METLVERFAGLDVHKDSVTACVRVPDNHGGRQAETRRFTTTTDVADAAWIAQLVEHGLVRPSFEVAPPSPGVARVDPTSSGSLAGRCWKPWWPAPTTRSCWRRWPRVWLRTKLPALWEALAGRFRTDHHGLLVAQILAHIDYLDETIATSRHGSSR